MRFVLLPHDVQARSIGQRLLRLWLVALLVGGFAHGSWANAEEVTLKQIRSEYLKSIAALKTVHVKCTVTPIHTQAFLDAAANAENTKPAQGEEVVAPSKITKWNTEWAIDGQKFLENSTGGEVATWFSYDGKQTWRLYYANGTPLESIRCASTEPLSTMTDSRLRSALTPGRWLGIYFAEAEQVQSGEGFGQMLAKPTAQYVREVDLDGHPAFHTKLTFTKLNRGNDAEYPVEVWFDREHGTLPRKITYPRSNNAIEYVVDEFSQVNGGWLPKRMRSGSRYGGVQLTVDEFTCGSPLPVTLFQPKLQPGCPVFKTATPAGKLELSHFLSGHEEAVKRFREENANRKAARLLSKPLQTMPQPLLAATPSDGHIRWPVVLLSLGMGLVLLSTVWWYLTMNRSV